MTDLRLIKNEPKRTTEQIKQDIIQDILAKPEEVLDFIMAVRQLEHSKRDMKEFLEERKKRKTKRRKSKKKLNNPFENAEESEQIVQTSKRFPNWTRTE